MNSFNTQIQCDENFEPTQEQIIELMREAAEVEHTNQLQMRIKDLEDRLNDYEEIREMAWQSANKSFFQKLMFWR